MTSNAIRYLEQKETVRSNLAQEQETNRSNLAKEKETERSNRAREEETKRHNIIEEVNTANYNTILDNHYVRQDIETQRSNIAKEGIERDKLYETQRSNIAREIETTRSNNLNFMIATRNADIEQQRVANDYVIRASQLALDTHRVKLDQARVGIEQAKVQVEQQKANQSYELGWLNYGVSKQQLEINRMNMQNQGSRWAAMTDIDRSHAQTDYQRMLGQNAANYAAAEVNKRKANTTYVDTTLNVIKSGVESASAMKRMSE